MCPLPHFTQLNMTGSPGGPGTQPQEPVYKNLFDSLFVMIYHFNLQKIEIKLQIYVLYDRFLAHDFFDFTKRLF